MVPYLLRSSSPRYIVVTIYITYIFVTIYIPPPKGWKEVDRFTTIIFLSLCSDNLSYFLLLRRNKTRVPRMGPHFRNGSRLTCSPVQEIKFMNLFKIIGYVNLVPIVCLSEI